MKALLFILLLASASFAQTKISVSHGGTGATTANGALTNLLPSQTSNSGKFLTTDGTNTSWATAGGGLTNWTESVNTSAPNATVPAVQFLATNAATNVDAVLTPKGSGALLAQVPDNTTTGGNKRGQNAVDWQQVRYNATAVASGQLSVISGGSDNTVNGYGSVIGGGNGNNTQYASYAVIGGGVTNVASTDYSVVGGGSTNTASGQYSTVSGGYNSTAGGSYSVISGGRSNTTTHDYSTIGGGYANTASGSSYSTVAGGYSNTASGQAAVVGGGQTNTASGQASAVVGGEDGHATGFKSVVVGGNSNTASAYYSVALGNLAKASLQGQIAFSGNGTVLGKRQGSIYTLSKSTTDATPTVLSLNGDASAVTLSVAASQAMTFTVLVVGKTSGTGATTVGGWRVSGVIYNNSGTATIVGTNTTETYNTPAGWSAPTVTGSGANLTITVTGAAATNILWVATVYTAEVTY